MELVALRWWRKAVRMKRNRLDVNIGCGRTILNFFLGASVFVLAVAVALLLIFGFLVYG